MPKIIDCEQGSREWWDARLGRITASRLNDVCSFLKSGKGEMKVRADYRVELIAERLTKQAQPHFVTDAMRWGTEQEPYARAAYEGWSGEMVAPVGFAIHPAMDFTGGSPDGLVGEDAIIEIKCPTTTTHLEWLEAGIVPEEHERQMFWNMHCCERERGVFISYDPRIPDAIQLFVTELTFDEAKVLELEKQVRQFEDEIQAQMIKIASYALQRA